MAEVASAFVSIMPSAKGFGAKLNSQVSGEIDDSGKKAGSRFGEAMKVGLLAGGAAIGALLGKAISSSSEAEQAIGGVESVFGKYADTVLADSRKAAQGLGLSATAYNELITVSGAMLKNKGLEDFADQSKNLVTIGADLSAMFGGSTTQAVEALNAAMRGESDPIERYGISLNETAVNAELAAKGQTNLTGAALEQAKTMARLSLIQKQSADATGAFGRESNTLAGQQARLKAQFDNMVVTVGTGLLPVLTSFATFVNGTLLPGLGASARFVKSNQVAFTALAVAIAAGVVITKTYAAVMAVQAAGGLLAMLKATRLVTASQWLLNAALTANPIGLVIVALVALGAGLVIAYKKSETFRKVVDGALSAVRAAGASVANFFTTKVPAAFEKVKSAASAALGWVKGNWPAILGILTGPFGSAVIAIAKNWDSIKQGGVKVVEYIKTIPGKILSVFDDLDGKMSAAGGKLMAMLASGIKAAVLKPYNELKAAADKLKSLLPGSPIKEGPLKPWNDGTPGVMLMEFLAKGIAKGGKKTREAMTEELDKLKGTLGTLRSDFASLAESVSGAFASDLFGVQATVADAEAGVAGATVGQNFINGLMAKKSELTSLLASFKTLKSWGVPASFLSQLFASGNGALITELAGMGQAGAVGAASLFSDVTNLGAQLGGAVAANDFGANIDKTTSEIKELRKDIKDLPKKQGKETADALKNVRFVVEGEGAGRRAYLRTGK